MTYYKSILLLALSSLPGGPILASPGWSSMLYWTDRYPSEKGGPQKSSFLDQPEIRAVIDKVLPKAERLELSKYDTEAPVRKLGNYMVVNKCLPHNCPSAMAMLVVEVTEKKIWVGFFSRKDQGTSTRWYGNLDDYSKLPDEIKKEFLTRHGD